MNLPTFIALCSRFEQLGGSVADQAAAVAVDHEPLEYQGPGSLRAFAGFLRAVQRESDDRQLCAEAAELEATIEEHFARRVVVDEIISD